MRDNLCAVVGASTPSGAGASTPSLGGASSGSSLSTNILAVLFEAERIVLTQGRSHWSSIDPIALCVPVLGIKMSKCPSDQTVASISRDGRLIVITGIVMVHDGNFVCFTLCYLAVAAFAVLRCHDGRDDE